MRPTNPWMLVVPGALVLAATLEGLWMSRRAARRANGQTANQTSGQAGDQATSAAAGQATNHAPRQATGQMTDHASGRAPPYDWKSYFASLGDLFIRMATGVLPLGLAAGALSWLWQHRLYTMPLTGPWPWVILFIGQDFCYYWMHRADHRVRWLWATHSVHHSPNTLNLSAAYRLGWTGRLSFAPLFFAPLVLFGYPPVLVGGALAANLFYQFWLHATWLPRLGPLEWLLNTPAHHRVHHASNPEYLDANFGGVLIVFDRLFGTFVAERPDVTIRYGLVEPIRSNNPLVIGVHGWLTIGRDLLAARSMRAAWHAAFGTPGPKAT